MTKLKWGMIGGGEGSQIGPAHRLGAGLDGLFEFTAGALDHRPEEGREYGQRLGLDADRSYGDWKEMLAGEASREDRVDLVSVATPNATHFEITKAFLEAGFNVLCASGRTSSSFARVHTSFSAGRWISASGPPWAMPPRMMMPAPASAASVIKS